ncbi:hypothetical protein AAFC00_004188 [Neodothiora populina]|uniref:PIN domain-like protein n=1 Tax=Neodothiora populina TaxID=2781224 RepID=A0ABR3PIU6_9PEZI
MGVAGLWTVVQPCARPIKIETLNKKRLAVDASIWIYQFLKAVRDKEGNALRNSHVVGFFRRICKLLFIGIKPVFVFDGGAPALKRQTIRGRTQRREGRREDATRTAGKLLALQMQRLAEEDDAKRKREAERGREEIEEDIGENPVYVDEILMTQQERQQNRKFKKKDQYHLPELDVSLAEMASNDPRIMSLEELEAYARQFDTGEDINVYDFSKIDFDSTFFTSLPASDRYNILNAARLRSRLRMGYSKEQLDTMFPDRMAFSKFQIERVTERNELTQRLMNINGMNDDGMFDTAGSGRIAGEKGREYVLVRNEGVEGGWALGVVGGNDEGRTESKPIDVDQIERAKQEEEEDWEEEDDEFEDVPIEGLNRLPKATKGPDGAKPIPVLQKKRAAYNARRRGPTKPQRTATRPVVDDPDSLFVADEDAAPVDIPDNADNEVASDEEDLQRAIAMSLEQGDADEEEDKEDWLDVFEQKRADEAQPLPRGRGQAIAHIVNNRANKFVPSAKSASPDKMEAAVESATTRPAHSALAADTDDSNDGSDSDDMDFQAALAESRKSKYQVKRKIPRPGPVESKPPTTSSTEPKKSAFGGPLPFEKLDLGSSLLGKKKMEKLQQENAGGFEKADTEKTKAKKEPLPPWFEGDLDDGLAAQKKIEQEDREKAKTFRESYEFQQLPTLQRRSSREVIDLDDEPDNTQPTENFIELESSDDEMFPVARNTSKQKEEPTMGDIADTIRADPPSPEPAPLSAKPPIPRPAEDMSMDSQPEVHTERDETSIQPEQSANAHDGAEDEPFEWEESDKEEGQEKTGPITNEKRELSESPLPDFEDADVPEQPNDATVEAAREKTASPDPQPTPASAPTSGLADQNLPADAGEDEFGYMSDSDDDELMRALAIEAEEHARFASTLNHKTQQQNVEDYERELKQLRSQQKKDRRDADEVTQVMIQECQQLLKLFGLPYITAPMEAEAQCAELVNLGLVDGIVTDDSDCFLFGGTRIYKNMFNQAKFVECYLISDLEKEFDLTRQKLIGLANLLGSDYTEGLPGVGPVTALEILSEFPSLSDFRSWFEAVQMNQIPKTEDAGNPFRKKFRRQASKLFLPPSFPDPRVDLAYLQPEVDSDPSPFQWGVPNLDALRSFLMATIGWSQERTDEVLVPVIKDMNRRMDEGTQSNITAFFDGGTGTGAYAPRKKVDMGSKRMGSALERLAREAKRKRKSGADVDGDDGDDDADEVAGSDNAAAAAAATAKSAPARKTRASRATTAKKSG